MPNPYDEILAEQQPAANGNPYDAVLPQVDPIEANLRRTLLGAMQNNPDEFAKARRLGQTYQVPADIVAADTPGWDAKARMDAVDFTALAKQSPAVSKWLSDYANASVAHDDINPLVEFERKARGIQQRGTLAEIVSAGSRGFRQQDDAIAAAAWAKGLISPRDLSLRLAESSRANLADQGNMSESARRFREARAAAAAAEKQRQREAKTAEALRLEAQVQGEMGPGEGPLSAIMRAATDDEIASMAAAENAAQLDQQFEEDVAAWQRAGEEAKALILNLWQWVADAAESPGGATTQVSESAAGSSIQLGSTLAAGLAGSALGPGGAMVSAAGAGGATGYVLEFGNWVNQALAERGVDMTDPDAIEAALNDPAVMGQILSDARGKALGTAGVDAIVSAFGGKILASAGKAGGTAVAKAAAATGRAAGDVGVQVAGDVASEAVGQAMTSQGINWADVADEAGGGFGQSVATSAIGYSVRRAAQAPREAVELVRNLRDATQAVDSAAAMSGAVEQLKASKTLARSPEAAQTFAQGAMADATVHYDAAEWDKLWSAAGQVPADVAEQLTGKADAYAMAKASGGEISVPMSRLVVMLAQMDNAQPVIEAGRVHGMSAAEARRFAREAPKRMAEIEQQQAKLADEVNALLAEAADQEAAQADQPTQQQVTAETVKRALFKQMETALIQAGRGKVESRTNAAWFAALEATRMERAGYTPEMALSMVPSIMAEGRTTELDVALDQLRRGALPTEQQMRGKSQGMNLDRAAAAAVEAGYTLPEATPNALLDALRDELGGFQATYTPEQENADAIARHQELLALEAV